MEVTRRFLIPRELLSPCFAYRCAYHDDLQVYGQVQGVFFRKYTEKRAKELGLVGWVKNTKSGTVAGQFQGSKEAVSQMKDWLMHTGSPESSITKCDFKSEKNVSKAEYSTFEVRHWKNTSCRFLQSLKTFFSGLCDSFLCYTAFVGRSNKEILLWNWVCIVVSSVFQLKESS